MSSVVVDKSERISHGADVHGGRGTVRVGFDFVPYTVEVASSCVVAVNVVSGIGDPEGSRGGVGLEHAGGLN